MRVFGISIEVQPLELNALCCRIYCVRLVKDRLDFVDQYLVDERFLDEWTLVDAVKLAHSIAVSGHHQDFCLGVHFPNTVGHLQAA